jgi:predicted CoA-binding protein
MASRVSRSFVSAREVLFIGYSKRQAGFCGNVKKAFEGAGTKVYPVNPNGGPAGVDAFKSLDAVPARPELAYVVTGRPNTAGIVDQLAARGVKRVLFQSRMSVDEATLARCVALGLDAAVGCPLMALGRGFHRFHGFLSGVRA